MVNSNLIVIKEVVKKILPQTFVLKRLRRFARNQFLLAYFKTYVQRFMSYGLLLSGCTSKN